MNDEEIIARAIAKGMIACESPELDEITLKRINLARAKKFAKIGKIARNAQGGRFSYIPVESLIGGEMLDMGRFIAFDPKTDNQGENTYNLRVAMHRDRIINKAPDSPEWVEGHYTESCGAIIRIWL